MTYKVLVCMLLLGIASEGISGRSLLVHPDEELEPILQDRLNATTPKSVSQYDDPALNEDDFRSASSNQNVHELSEDDVSGVDVEDLVVRESAESNHGSSSSHDHVSSSSHNHGPSNSHNHGIHDHHGSPSGYDDGSHALSSFGYGYPPATPYGYDVNPAFAAHGYGGIQQPYYGANSHFVGSPAYNHGPLAPYGGHGFPSHGRHGSKLSHARYGSAYAGYNSPRASYGGYGSRYGGYGSRLARGYGSPYGGLGPRFSGGYGSGYGSRFVGGYGSGYGSRFVGGYGSGYDSRFVGGYGSPYAGFSPYSRGHGKKY